MPFERQNSIHVYHVEIREGFLIEKLDFVVCTTMFYCITLLLLLLLLLVVVVVVVVIAVVVALATVQTLHV
jgi:hypothetical protein